jgi:hypothetical protein
LEQKPRREFVFAGIERISACVRWSRFVSKFLSAKLQVKIEFSQRALNLIGRSVHREHFINAGSAL